MGNDLDLDQYLAGLRQAARLSVEQVSQHTKIQARYVTALESGQWGEVPSNTHLRAFSLAIAKACGGDAEHAAVLVRRVLAASAPVGPAPRTFDTPAPHPAEAQRPKVAAVAAVSDIPAAGTARLAPAGPGFAAPVRASSLASASARLRSLPLTALLALVAVAGGLSYGAAWGVEQWQHRTARLALAAATADAEKPATETAVSASAAAPKQETPVPAVPAAVQADAGPAAAAAPGMQLTLRARRDCWLVLQVDGRRLPTVTMKDGDKLYWTVHQRAVMLAGNLGALRVWWLGDNQGYLGELGQRANAIVFERGRPPRLDKGAALPLPSGVPE